MSIKSDEGVKILLSPSEAVHILESGEHFVEEFIFRIRGDELGGGVRDIGVGVEGVSAVGVENILEIDPRVGVRGDTQFKFSFEEHEGIELVIMGVIEVKINF